MNSILILGTGADINKIDFSKINKSFITAGVNRIYEVYNPDYYYCYDLITVMQDLPDFVKVVYTHPDKFYEYLYKTRNYKQNFCTYYDAEYTPEFTLCGRTFDCGHGSINYLIRALNDYVFRGQDNIFYIAGVPLLEQIGHFYDDSESITNQAVLDRFYYDFLRLVDRGYKMISVMESSRLNDIMPVYNLDCIYNDPKEINYDYEYHIKIKEIIHAISKPTCR